MQREIEDLLESLHCEQRREQKLVSNLLVAISAASSARQRLFENVANAILEAMMPAATSAPSFRCTEQDLTEALQAMLRNARWHDARH